MPARRRIAEGGKNQPVEAKSRDRNSTLTPNDGFCLDRPPNFPIRADLLQLLYIFEECVFQFWTLTPEGIPPDFLFAQ